MNALIRSIEVGIVDFIQLLLNNPKIDINQILINFYDFIFIFLILYSFL